MVVGGRLGVAVYVASASACDLDDCHFYSVVNLDVGDLGEACIGVVVLVCVAAGDLAARYPIVVARETFVACWKVNARPAPSWLMIALRTRQTLQGLSARREQVPLQSRRPRLIATL